MSGPHVATRVKQKTTSTGAGNLTLTSVTGFRDFETIIGTGNTFYYTIFGQTGASVGEFEDGIGSVTGSVLTRSTVFENNLGTTAFINFSSGDKFVLLTLLPAEYARRYCSLVLSAAQSIVNNTFTSVDWDTEISDQYDMHDGVNPSRITVDIPGIYLFTFNGLWASNSTNDRFIGLRINAGANHAVSNLILAAGTTNPAQAVSKPLQLNATDYVEARVWQNSGGNLDFGAASNGSRLDSANFTVWRLGRVA